MQSETDTVTRAAATSDERRTTTADASAAERRPASNPLERTTDGPRVLTMVVPTRNEAESVGALLERLAPVLDGMGADVLFVDDSDDATPQLIELAHELGHFNFPISVLHREGEARAGGLGSAVVAGLRAARGTWVCVMDADLQHPPEHVRDLLATAVGRNCDVVVASRYCGAGESDLSPLRHFVSRLSTHAARLLFFRTLRTVTDPMSGFFIVRKQKVRPEALRPNGFKILLEILVRCPDLSAIEIPFRLHERDLGESKGSLREGMRYANHLLRLRFAKPSATIAAR